MRSTLSSFIKNNKKEFIFISSMFLLTVIVCLAQFIGVEKSITLDLTDSTKVSTRDDRVSKGASISSYQMTAEGVKFTCEIIQSEFRWPYCELKFNLSSNSDGKLLGLDLSSFERIGLWIDHDHESQPGTRIELHNFNSAYSTESKNDSLKYNSIEFSEKKVPSPTWIDLHRFYVPTWWNARHDLAVGGTDFSNIRTMSVTTAGDITEGTYKLTVKRIEFRGKYIENDTLFFLLLIVWSSVAGFFIRELSLSKDKVISVNKQKVKWQEAAFTDTLTGVNNRESSREIFNNLLAKSNTLSLLFIDIDFFKKINDTYGHNVGDEILVQFSKIILETVDDSNILIRWGGEEFLLLCPNYNLFQAKLIAEKIRLSIEQSLWVENIKLTASFGVAEKNHLTISELINKADEALYQAKENGRNQVVASDMAENVS
jgi:diguanylate cyclase (GGDEF)-like protein